MGKNKKRKKRKSSKDVQKSKFAKKKQEGEEVYQKSSPTAAHESDLKGRKRQYSLDDDNCSHESSRTGNDPDFQSLQQEQMGQKRPKRAAENEQSTETAVNRMFGEGTSQIGNATGFSDSRTMDVNQRSAAGQYPYQEFTNIYCYGNGNQNLGYLNDLLHNVDHRSLNGILGQISNLPWGMLNKEEVDRHIQWIVEKANHGSITPEQGLYLCFVLSNFGNDAVTGIPQCDERKRAFDTLLDCLAMCGKYGVYISPSFICPLQQASCELVMNSSYPGWLTFAAHLFPLFGFNMSFLLWHEFPLANYEINKYHDLFWFLIPQIEDVNRKNERNLRKFLERVLQSAPEHDLFQLCERQEMRRFFFNAKERQKFFTDCYLNRLNSSENNTDISIGEILKKLLIIPKKHRSLKWAALYDYLVKFAESDVNPTGEDINAFIEISLSLQNDQVFDILSLLSQSSLTSHQDIVLQLLRHDKFGADKWKHVGSKNKVQIGKLWLTTRIKTDKSDVGKVLTAYRCLEEFISCPLVCKIQPLTTKLLDIVHKWIFDNVNHTSIIEQTGEIENIRDFTQNVQESLFKLVREVLNKNYQIMVNRNELLNQFFNSSSRTRLLTCVLEEFPAIPKRPQSADERDFGIMLSFCEVWITLFRAGDHKIEQHEKFKTGKRVWQRLAACLKKEEISVKFLSRVEACKNELSLILAYVKSKSEQEVHSYRQDNLEMIGRLVDKEKTVRSKISLLESAIIFGKKVNSAQIPRLFNERKEHLNTMKLEELNDEFWGPLLPLLELSSRLESVMGSVSFRNVAGDCLLETGDIQSSTSDDGDIDRLHSLFKFLTNCAIPRFEAEWKKLCDDPDSQTFETMKILRGLRSEDNLVSELSILASFLKIQAIPMNLQHYMEDYVRYESVMKQVGNILRVLGIFGLRNPDNDLVAILTEFERDFGNCRLFTSRHLHGPMAEVQKIVCQIINENNRNVIDVLGESRELLDFLKEIVNEDIRVLIDAVEEHSDEFVSESLVSDLIHVHAFLAPVIEKYQDSTSTQLPKEVLLKLQDQCKNHKNMEVKIVQCNQHVHSLKQLYKSVANRGEVTRDIITACIASGKVSVSLEETGTCNIYMKYMKKDEEAKYLLSDLHDLRSRAHLIVNSDRSRNYTSNNVEHMDLSIDFADFIEQVNIMSDIEGLILKLRSSGYIKYRTIDQVTVTGTKELQHMKEELFKELQLWENSLHDARQQFCFLNYYWSDQLFVLYDFLTNLDRTKVDFGDVLTLIHFVDPTIDEQRLREYEENHLIQGQYSNDPSEIVLAIGNALNDIFSNIRHVAKPIAEKETSSFIQQQIGQTVQPGELYVAILNKESAATVNVMLSLYENTSNAYPKPYQIVFCDPNKRWKEIQLFLQRCFTPKKHVEQKSLFCLANVELLENEVQFKLIDFIKERQKNNPDYLLAIICRGGDNYHIVEEFSQFSHPITGFSYPEVATRLKSAWPNVKCMTSTLPGLGKTESIRQEVQENGMNVVTFPISGQLDESNIIQRLKQLDLKHFQCLHFDIGEVDDPFLLDTFLFQLIVTGMVSCGTQLYSLRNTRVYIEISNSLDDRLRKSLVISQCFHCVELQWNNYEDFKVSSKIASNIQVVCQYLDAFDRDRLESTDIYFFGNKKTNSLSATRCRELLCKYYSTDTGTSNVDTTFTALNTFLGLLADQLRKFSKSSFFKTDQIKCMVDKKATGVRRNLFKALLDVSKKFAARALKTCSSKDRSAQVNSSQVLNTAAEHMIKRVEGMIHWEQSNHLLIVFHGINSQAITAFYRKKDDVPSEISDLLRNQTVREKNKQLDDFETMTQEKLHEKMEKIVRTKPRSDSTKETRCQESEITGYALTPDNMLKMILIILRVRANVPIIIMGETGCGKTSLVKYLANTCEIPLFTLNFHAGRTEYEIKRFVKEKDQEAQESNETIWVFFDEINTCDHLGLINEILCHHTMGGQPLATNLVFLAACNPYKKRPQERSGVIAGLERKDMTDEYSELVYRVHPLPEAMVDYVWDYGSLTPQDEKAYIQRMVQKLPTEHQNALVDLLAASQTFIRESERNPFCVSLRDVGRCILLVQWFMNMIKKRTDVMRGTPNTGLQKHLKNYRDLAQKYIEESEIKGCVLALAHCYLSRLETDELRNCYLERMEQVFLKFSKTVTSEDFSAIIRMEQEDYLDRMELPPGTARNAALRENVFVMLVSILNRIPVFVVGKPGCSKSLSIQLIRSNLRGKDSKDPFFRTLPQLYVVSYQGSESSTSEGINKIFEIASKYKEHNKDANVLPVVLLDEVGLAENSPNNPLKVLHNILEPGKGKLPDVAVVGISNWALDAAKMNRAIHLSRPEPTVKDLEETAISLYYGESKSREQIESSTSHDVLNCLANAYHEYQSRQGHANFHGLRDYYSLVKSLHADSCNDMNQINVALQRNFGGILKESSKVQEIFIDKLKSHVPTSGRDSKIPVMKLIQENLADSKARHLMLLTKGDSAIGILKQNLSQSVKETVTIFGSRFEEDLYDDYNYRMLSRIILCMERDCVLILRDLECIYGSLYDMLNQNYAVVGKRKNCRVALGAYSNPMCYVNDGFRCIVLVDCVEVDYSDPPFLNRFEKQLLRFSDVLTEQQQEIIAELESWVYQMSTGEELSELFKESDMFMGFNEDTLPSLVLLHSNDTDEPNEIIVKKCKDDLMWIATPDGVLRTQKCKRLEEDSREVKMLTEEYFEKPIHNGLASFISYVVQDQEFAYSTGGKVGSKTIVMTYATVHTDINKCLDDTTTYQLERLGAYKSEKQLEDRIHDFFSSDKKLLILQCKPELDGEHMLLARSIIEEKRKSYKKSYRQSNSTKPRKNVCILVHLRRGENINAIHWQLNYLCGWKQVFIDVIEEPAVPMNEIQSESIDNLLMRSKWSFKNFSKDSKCLLWCFKCIKYIKEQRSLDRILDIAKRFFESEKVYNTIQKLVMEYVNSIIAEEKNECWPVKVACNKKSLINSCTFSSAIENYLSLLVREPLAKIIYFLEQENSWPAHVLTSDKDNLPEYEDVWCDLIAKDSILNISKIPAPRGTESYTVDGVRLELSVPFSQVIIRKVNVAKEQVLKEYLEENEREHSQAEQEKRMQHYTEIVTSLVPDILDLPGPFLNSYTDDFLDATLAFFSGNIERQQRILIGNCAFLSFANGYGLSAKDPLQRCVQFHLFVWIFGQQMIDQIRMIDSCGQFVNLEAIYPQINKYQSAMDLSLTDNNIISTDEAGMKMDAGGESSEKFNHGLKRKCAQFQQPADDDDQNDSLPRKKTKYSSNNLDSKNDSQESGKYSDRNENESSDIDRNENSDIGTSDDEESSGDTSDSESSSSEDESNTHLPISEGNDVHEGCFEDILVTTFCEKMFPSESKVNRNGGLESWIRNSSLLLSLAFKVSNQTPAFHYLRLCVDYAKMVERRGIPEHYLYDLDEMAKELKPEYLDKDGSLQNLTTRLVNPLEKQCMHGEEQYVVIQKFLAKFYSRCIDTYEDTESAVPIVKNLFSLDREDLVLLMKPVIYSLLQASQTESPVIFFDIIINQSVDESHSCLRDIDEVFRERYEHGFINHDSYPAVMICDLISAIQPFDDCFNIEELKSTDSKLLKCFRCATNVVTGGKCSTGLVLLSSVAFLRAFFTMLSKRPSILTSETPYSHVMGEINSLLAAGGARRSSIQMFFLKQLYGAGMTMFELRKLCRESEKLPVIKNQLEQSKINNKVELVSVYRLPEYKEVKDAYWNLNQQNESDMLGILTKCENSANHRLALLGMLVNTFYVKKAVGNLSDNEERLADWFSVKSKDLPSPLKELLLRIIGRQTFNHRALQISLESSTDEIEIALLILHVLCVVASRLEGQISPLVQYFSNPEKCHDTWIPADKGRLHEVFDQRKLPSYLTPANCCCGVRIQFQENSQHNRCPFCSEDFAIPNIDDTTIPSMKVYCLRTNSTDWHKRSENMDIFVFRSLHLILHACLYAGIATGISSKEAVSPVLRPDQQESTSERTGEDSADFCLNRIKDDLQCLKSILSCKTRTAVDVMHLVIEECTALIQGKILGKNILSTREECLEWENEFSNIAEELLPKALGSARPLKETRMMFDDENGEHSLIENQIQELDEYPSDSEQQDEKLKRLFRVTKHPSFTELRCIFLNFHVFREQHIVLALFLSKFEELPYLGCLFPLLRWTRRVSSTLTHRISREEARSKFINDFNNGQILGQDWNENEAEVIRNNLKEFIDAWNKMRDFVNQELPAGEEKMPFLMKHTCKLGYCLTEGDLGIYLRTAIKILQSIQNEILDELLLTSIRTRHPALSFLEKNETCCAIMSVSLQEAKEKDIINFDWSDEFLKYAQKLEYGHGEDIDYDFQRMETELANEIAFGKCHLAESLNTFTFSKELFHSSAKVLTKIRELCPQSQSLPEEIRNGLSGLKERRIQDAQNLIQHVEVVIFVLNIQSTPIEQEMTIVEFANKWESKLPTPFPVDLLPEPKASIKLTHIAALYEALEDLLADGTIGGLPKQFRAKLTDEAKGSLDGLVDSRNGSLKLQQFLTALRRFVFRYLSAEKFLPEPHKPLRSCLSEPSLWSPDEAPGPDVIPREMTLANIHDIIAHLEQEQNGHSRALGGNSSYRTSKKVRRHGRKVCRS